MINIERYNYPIHYRLREFIDNQGLSISEFEKKCEIQPGTLSKALKNHTNFGVYFIWIIFDCFPMLNLDWLIMGDGEMLKTEAFSYKNTNNTNEIENLQKELNEWKEKYYLESEKYKNCIEKGQILNLTGIGIKKQKSTKDV